MSSNLPATTDGTALVEQVVVRGDLSALTPDQKSRYYVQICESLGLNPYTQPFGIYKLNGKEIMYAKKDAAEQLRKLNGISVTGITRDVMDGVLLVTVSVRTRDGREDTDVGAVPIQNLKGTDLANAIMKAITKGKRRATLSISGLGMLDETEVETIPGASAMPTITVDHETGEIMDTPTSARNAPRAIEASGQVADDPDTPQPATRRQREMIEERWGALRLDPKQLGPQCRKFYGTPYGELSRDHATDLIAKLDQKITEASPNGVTRQPPDDAPDDAGLSDDEIRQIGVEIEAEAAPAVSGGAGNDQWSN